METFTGLDGLLCQKTAKQATPTRRRQVVYSVLTFTQVRERKLKVKQNQDVYQVQSQNRRLKRKKTVKCTTLEAQSMPGYAEATPPLPLRVLFNLLENDDPFM